jgi:hypothetical protein
LSFSSSLSAAEWCSIEGSWAYSFRFKSFTGMAGVRSKDFCDGWLTAKGFGLPEFKEYGLGLEVNLLNKLKEREDIKEFFKIIDITLGIYGGIIPKDPIEKSQGDGGFCGYVIKIPIGGTK